MTEPEQNYLDTIEALCRRLAEHHDPPEIEPYPVGAGCFKALAAAGIITPQGRLTDKALQDQADLNRKEKP
jgi:hypothetical protein